ncbi:restriction endonuclease [archaeon]|nr:restriction endonuclease [archaeon]
MIVMRIIKASGKRQKFNPEKIRKSLLRTGLSRSEADGIIYEVEKKIHDGMTSRQVFKVVMRELNEKQAVMASRYDLKGSILRMGPAGFNFETYVAGVLEEYGYDTELRAKIRGSCATHEIDIVAVDRDSGMRHFIECKYHNSLGTYIDLKEALYTYARFSDLTNGGEHFDSVWMACNTRASTPAIKYANCTGMKLLCWRYPQDRGLERMIEDKNLYPLTMLRSIDEHSLDKFSRAGYMLIKDLTKNDFNSLKNKTRLKTKKLQRIVEEARGVARENNFEA